MNRASDTAVSPWTYFLALVVGFAVLAFLTRGDTLDAKTKERPRNPMVQVHLRDLPREERLTLDIEGIWELRTKDGTLLARDTGLRGWLEWRAEGLSVAGWKSDHDHLILAAFGDAALSLDSYTYRGRLHLKRVRKESGERRIELSLELPLEDYVLGVLIGEMSTQGRGIEAALQAQAIAARTYVIHQLRKGRTMVRSTVADQRFLSVDFETQAARDAVKQTAGLVLTENDAILPAYFHADCGGHTSTASEHGFGNHASLRGVPEIGDRDHSGRTESWQRTIPPDQLDAYAQELSVGQYAKNLRILHRDNAGRVVKVRFEGDSGQSRDLYGERLRARFSLPSAMITLMGVLRDGSLRVEGVGRGHGIGLCQLGAIAQAKAGRSAQQILAHYYPGADLEIFSEPIEL